MSTGAKVLLAIVFGLIIASLLFEAATGGLTLNAASVAAFCVGGLMLDAHLLRLAWRSHRSDVARNAALFDHHLRSGHYRTPRGPKAF